MSNRKCVSSFSFASEKSRFLVSLNFRNIKSAREFVSEVLSLEEETLLDDLLKISCLYLQAYYQGVKVCDANPQSKEFFEEKKAGYKGHISVDIFYDLRYPRQHYDPEDSRLGIYLYKTGEAPPPMVALDFFHEGED